jgi:valyl-tRNA synthetase
MDKTYNPQHIETRWYATWEERGYFRPGGDGAPYCIMLPPPNVTGSLHMGHAFQDTLMDILIRYQRMRGRRVLWQCGTDHAGIATQMVVERQLEAEGTSRLALGREEFLRRVWEWKSESGGAITRQLRRLGASMDWSRERFTLDDGLSRAVTEVFVRMYQEGLIYRGKRLVNWDPLLHTAISDLEVVNEEENGHLWHIRYPLADGSGYLVVATTRPETMLGDTAVAVHPEDERYRRLIGKTVRLPLAEREIPIIADEYVDPEFGTGCLKITPAHDFNDYAVGQRHGLPLINIFTPDAKIKSSPLDDFSWGHGAPGKHGVSADDNGLARPATVELIPTQYRGLDRFAARKRVVADLQKAGLLEKIEAHKLVVPRGDRTGAVIEPYLTDQWYVKAAPLAAEAIKAVEDGRIRFVPENWSKTYYEWMRNIQDWCISRQLWWGHRIPAWYDNTGNIYVGRDEADAYKAYFNHLLDAEKNNKLRDDYLRILGTYELSGRDPNVIPKQYQLRRDEDVLDTWFSSALWPFSTLGWPEKTPEFETFYPTSVLVTGFDIIFFWVARMIMLGLKFTGDVPFREVYIHGLVRDADGQKMSKSKGNILDPLDLIDGIDLESLVQKRTNGLMRPQLAKKIEQASRKQFPQGIAGYGTDSLRFTFASLATQGRDIRFDVGRIEGYRNFCNKLWNAARYVLLCMNNKDDSDHDGPLELGLAERWIISRLQQAARDITDNIHAYRFDLAAQAIYEFTWDEYCDWYLELSKTVLNDPDSNAAARRGTRRTLAQVLEILVRLAHPFIPFITEEIWQRIAPHAGRAATAESTIMLQPYPQPDPALIDQPALAVMAWIKAFIIGVRRIRAEYDIAPSALLHVETHGGTPEERAWLDAHRRYLCELGRIESITPVTQARADRATALAGAMTLLIPLSELIDRDAELKRLKKELDRIRADRERCGGKLGNSDFLERAPPEIVARERQRYEELGAALQKLEQQYERIRSL